MLRPPAQGGLHSGTQTPLGIIRPGLSLYMVREPGSDSVCWQSHLPSCHDTIRCARIFCSSKSGGPTAPAFSGSVLGMQSLRPCSRPTEAESIFLRRSLEIHIHIKVWEALAWHTDQLSFFKDRFCAICPCPVELVEAQLFIVLNIYMQRHTFMTVLRLLKNAEWL